jgi:opacity protein-like surface antigen
MQLGVKAIAKATILMMAVASVLSMTAAAQEVRSEINVQGTGFFTSNRDNNGITHRTTNTGGFLLGYRYNVNNWLSAEANYGWTQNSQLYSGDFGAASVRADVHQVTGSAVVKLPTIFRLQPFVRAGGGTLIFDPTDASGNFFGATSETRGAFLYGAGADYAFTRHLALRAEYRGFVYKAPSFNLVSLNSDAWTHTAQPSAGIVFKF